MCIPLSPGAHHSQPSLQARPQSSEVSAAPILLLQLFADLFQQRVEGMSATELKKRNKGGFTFCFALQLCVMEHFYWQPLSLLCSSSVLQAKHWPEKMTSGFCEAVRSTPSFQRYQCICAYIGIPISHNTCTHTRAVDTHMHMRKLVWGTQIALLL